MADRKSPIASGNADADKREEKALREREEAGLEPERLTGPRQNEGISSAGHLYATPEEAEEARQQGETERGNVDREAARVLGDRNARKDPAPE